MISDILSDALDDVESFQAEFGDIYQGTSVAIYKVTTVMTSLLRLLDAPWLDKYPTYNAAVERLQTEIEAIDVNGLLNALNDLQMSCPSSGSAASIPLTGAEASVAEELSKHAPSMPTGSQNSR